MERIKEIAYYFLVKLPGILRGRVRGNLIFVHWGRGLNNFGDCLSPDILKHFGLTPVYCQQVKSDMILAGSLLQWVPENYTGIILGTGAADVPLNFPAARVLGVRGKLTWNNFRSKNTDHVLYGDTGLIMSYIFPETVRKKYRMGVVPHFIDYGHRYMKMWKERFGKDVLFIHPLGSPRQIISRIKSCESIVASSLHGLVIADSFDIPSLRFVIRETMPLGTVDPDYKYKDYYSALGLEHVCVEVNGGEDIEDLIGRATTKTHAVVPIKRALYDTLKETCEYFKLKSVV
ncbi:polysaccharide pyruvyl transferase family protein [Chitinophaga sp. G-6-1-13]|uniref:Polysaccharide pyruvyl transferase family protein n=1 Tax=Chitinophaga fulva TaxID=2728842 RepID=A0A848GHR5_9BACT|nr:polysaccharide pyruvyl transferase family protein [Chitinophaga fulva]NML37261.1 polysaccharide pyruvyl transferase family protein [Chitinophaga fulva]